MLEPIPALLICSIGAVWMGYFLEKGFQQAATYNLIGKGSRHGASPEQVQDIVDRHFDGRNWLWMAASLSAMFSAIYSFVALSTWLPSAALGVFAVGAFLKCMVSVHRAYRGSDRELVSGNPRRSE